MHVKQTAGARLLASLHSLTGRSRCSYHLACGRGSSLGGWWWWCSSWHWPTSFGVGWMSCCWPSRAQEPRPHVSLEEPAEKVLLNEAPKDEEDEWWESLMGYDQKFMLEDLIPDPEGTEMPDQRDEQEQPSRLLSLLDELPTAQRQAFILYVLEDYEPLEIAMLQERPEPEVKADIEAARQMLKERLGEIGDRR
jgi:Sigma-70, region 4